MKSHPILFSGPMIRAILEGRKTQTRRIIKLPPAPTRLGQWEPSEIGGDGSTYADGTPTRKTVCIWHTRTGKCIATKWQAGDLLWVRENWRPNDIWPDRVVYRVDTPQEALGPWKPSIHMPRWASRITLEVEAVKVERLKDISDEDAKAEGIFQFTGIGCYGYDKQGTPGPHCCDTARDTYACLWESINGPGSWKANPWVAAVTFKAHLQNIDKIAAVPVAMRAGGANTSLTSPPALDIARE